MENLDGKDYGITSLLIQISTMHALVSKVTDGSPSFVKSSIQVPIPASNQALIRVSHVAQNFTDGKQRVPRPLGDISGHEPSYRETVESFDSDEFGDGSVLGRDFVGEVETIGAGVSKMKEGDVIAGLIWGGDIKGLGGFSEYTLADEQLCFKLPPNLTRAEAATVPLAACTAWLALFSQSCLDMYQKQGSDNLVLIWGGSFQIANLYKFRIIATCGPRSFELVKSLGAHHVLNYYDKDVVAQVRGLAPSLGHALDAVGSSISPATVSQTLAGRGGNLCGIRPGKAYVANIAPRANISDVSVWSAFKQEHQLKDISFAPSVNAHESAAQFFDILPKWLEDGIIKADSPRILAGGLDAVQRGFEIDRPGKSLGCKIVYEI